MNANILTQLQEFTKLLNKEPDPKELSSTPDGRAKTLPISYVEMTLDEIFAGQWGTRNFTTRVIANEVCGELELYVMHPVTGNEITRVGSAAIIIQVDRAPDGVNKNEWANDPRNKKPNALDLGYPKLKAECVKNAAASLGKVFGRDINRKESDSFKRQYVVIPDNIIKAALDRIEGGDDAVRIVAALEATGIVTDLQKELLMGTKQKQLA